MSEALSPSDPDITVSVVPSGCAMVWEVVGLSCTKLPPPLGGMFKIPFSRLALLDPGTVVRAIINDPMLATAVPPPPVPPVTVTVGVLVYP